MTTGTVTQADRRFMRRALELAGRGWGRVHPNPLVGAVVVRDGEVVGEGYHAEYGGPHAEVAALEAAGERARGATVYVSLEPCNHHGKTPPCTDALLAAGVRRLVYGAEDPHPRASGGGDRLRRHGLDVLGGVEREAVRAQNAAFFHTVETRTPYLVLKYGLTLDGRIAEAEGRTTAVTGRPARAEVHRLRAGFDGILVGGRTARIDDPLLTVRGAVTPRVPPVRLVMDRHARLPLESRLVRTARDVPVWVLCSDDAPAERRRALEAAGVRTLAVPATDQGLDPDAALDRLWQEGIRSIFCEGGGRLGASFLAADRVERLHLFYAPRIFGPAGVPAFPLAGATGPEGWRTHRVERFGDDVLITLDRRRSAPGSAG